MKKQFLKKQEWIHVAAKISLSAHTAKTVFKIQNQNRKISKVRLLFVTISKLRFAKWKVVFKFARQFYKKLR